MQSIIQKLSAIVGGAFQSEGLDTAFGLVRYSDRKDLAQFQCNGAMAAAKAAKSNPRALAEKIVAKLQSDTTFSKIELAGPGFINLTVTDAYLTQHVTEISRDGRLGVAHLYHGETVILDYGGPNVAKPMHVGHLRSSIIGDSLRRILQFAGYKTVGDIHMGDWGTQMGMMISELELQHPDWPYFDPNKTSGYPTDTPVTMEDFETIYPRVSAQCKEDPARLELSKKAVVDLQNKRPGYYALWQKFVEVSLVSMKQNFAALNVHFDLWKGETDVHDLIAPMVEKLRRQGYAVESEGATVVHVKRDDDNQEYPPLILYKSDGGVLYGTTDLATLVERERDFHPIKVIYVVDKRQALHFEQVFRAAKLTHIVPETTELTHIGYGTMNGTDGKPFKTRAGGVMKLEDLIAMGEAKAQERLAEVEAIKGFSDEERDDIAHKVAIAAIKFTDLQNPSTTDYIFDIDRMTSFEGRTGPYMLYQTVRIRSLLEKAGVDPAIFHAPITITDSDRALWLTLTELPGVITYAAKNYTPHTLCEHVFRISQEFATFYAANYILTEEDKVLRESWLMLCVNVYKQLELLLNLLGLLIPRRM